MRLTVTPVAGPRSPPGLDVPAVHEPVEDELELPVVPSPQPVYQRETVPRRDAAREWVKKETKK